MKKNVIVFVLLIASLAVFAENKAYKNEMKKNIEQTAKAQSLDELLEMSNNFERIAMAENDQWLPWYYAAYASINACYMGLPKSKMDQRLDKAQEMIDKAGELSPENDEIEVLQGFLYQTRIQVDPQSRGQQYSMQSNANFAKAIKMNPDNPRADFLMAQNLLYTPAAFGGGPENACPKYRSAAEKFATFKPASELAPNWGESMNREMMKKNCN